MKVLAIGATNSTSSINKQLATYAAGLAEGADVEVLDLNCPNLSASPVCNGGA